jgi:hypothetical protein
MKVRQEHGFDSPRIDAQAVEMGQQRRAAVQQQTAIDDHCAVVPVERERGPAAEEGEL